MTAAILFLAGLDGMAAPSSCSDLFQVRPSKLGNAKKASVQHPKKLVPLAEAFRAQRRLGVPLASIRIPVTPEIRETLEWLDTQMHDLLAQNKLEFASNKQKLNVESFANSLKDLKSSDDIGYINYLRQAQTFSVIMELQKDTLPPDRNDKTMIFNYVERVLERNNSNEYLSYFADYIDKLNHKQPWLLFPTFKELDINVMNVAFSEGISYVGLTLNRVWVDGQHMRPEVFFGHDLAHTSGFELFGDNPPLSIAERRQLFKKFEAWMKESKLSVSEKNLLQNLWFLALHENQQVMHPRNLEKYFQRRLDDYASGSTAVKKSDLKFINDVKEVDSRPNGRVITTREILESYYQLTLFMKGQN
jgi:hypothetical protein